MADFMTDKYRKELGDVVLLARNHSNGLRLGQLLYNAIGYWDQSHEQIIDEEYDSNFHSRLFNIEGEELVNALESWFKYEDSKRRVKR